MLATPKICTQILGVRFPQKKKKVRSFWKGGKCMSRQKNSCIFVRATEEEKESLKQNAKQSRMTMSEYVLALNKQKKINVVNGISELVVELTRIGVNINQIATVANQKKNVSDYQLDLVLDKLSECQKIMSKIIKLVYGDYDDIEV